MSQPNRQLSRRTLFAGVGTLGAVAATATLAPRVLTVPDTAPQPQPQPAPPDRGGGYQLSAHVQRYYKTTRL